MAQLYRYYVGNSGPQTFRAEGDELPFRIELIDHLLDQGNIRNVAMNVTSIVGADAELNRGDVTTADFSVFRAAHFNAFNIAGDLL
jgi:hypothetical protein